MAKVVINVNTRESAANVRSGLAFSPKRTPDGILDNLLKGKIDGMSIQLLNEDAVAASATITFSGVGAADDTILVNGQTFTAVAASAAGNQWDVGASAAASAANLALAINQSAKQYSF
jgi:hypothetical protein